MDNKEIEKIRMKAEDEYQTMKDKIHELYEDKKNLESKVEELEYEIERLKKAKQDSEEYYQEYWKPIPSNKLYGVSDEDFH